MRTKNLLPTKLLTAPLIPVLLGLCLQGCANRQLQKPRENGMLENNLPPGVRFLNAQPLGKDFIVQQFELDNGLKIILMEDHGAPLFAYHTWMRVGSRWERPGITGIAHLFEHLMFKATKNHPDGYFDNIMEKNGGSINAGTSKDWTYYHENIPSSNLDLVASLEADRLQNVELTDEQINTEREVVKEERRMRTEDSIDGQIDEQLYAKAFHKHPYSWPVIGSMKDIGSINRQDCLEFYKTYYAPNNATLVITGDFSSEKALKTIIKYYGAIPASKINPLKVPLDPPQKSEQRSTIRKKSLLDDKLVMAFHIPNAQHADRPVLQILNSLLVEGKSSRLYRKLVDEQKIATAVNGNIDEYMDPGLFKISVAMARGHSADEAEKVIYEAIAQLQRELADEKELEKTKNTVEAFYLRILKTNQYKAFMLGYYQTLFGDYREMFKEIDRYRAVSALDIKRAANTYLTQNQRTVIVAKPAA